MRSPEKTATLQKEKSIKIPEFAHCFLEVLGNPFGFNKQIKLWRSQRYIEAAMLAKPALSETEPQILRELSTDLFSFFDEYAGFLPVITYDYGINGMKNGYEKTIEAVAQAHIDYLSSNNLALDRGYMEKNVARTVQAWMQTPNLEVGARIMTVSPRGSKEEGYPGTHKKNYVFITLFEKTEQGFLFKQYRSYDLNDQLLDLQAKAVTELGGTLTPATPEKQYRKDLQIIANVITLPPTTTIQSIESSIYAHKESWAVNVEKELPNLNGSDYYSVAAKSVNFCVQQFSHLIHDPDFSPTAEEHFTLLVTTVKESLIKWVETHATNYESKQPDHEMDFDQIVAVWKTRCAKADGEELDKGQKSLLKDFQQLTALDPSLPLKSLSSWAHCIVGSPISMMQLQNPELMKSLQMNQLNYTQLEKLIGKERAALWKKGTCVRCGDHAMVGECSICMKCELELGGQAPINMMEDTETRFLDSLSYDDKNEGKELFSKFSKLVLRETVSFEQLIHNDFANPEAAKNEALEPLINRILFAHNPIEVLREIISELSTENEQKDHKKYVMPKAPQTAVAAA